jgi:hypothetical protein
MNAVTVDVKDMLVAETSLALVFATNLFVGKEPDYPDESVTLYDTAGMPPQLTFDPLERYERPSFQVRVRSNSYTVGWNLTHNIMCALHGRAQETWNGTLYSVIYCSSGPALLDWDTNGRVRFVCNFNVQRR